MWTELEAALRAVERGALFLSPTISQYVVRDYLKRTEPGVTELTARVLQDQQEPVDVINMPLTKVVHMIRGPKATKVTLTVLRNGQSIEVPVTLGTQPSQ